MRTPKYWRERAEEARVAMEGMTDHEARNTMALIVKHCEELAVLMEGLISKGIVQADDDP